MAFNHHDHYHRLMLRQMPKGAARALDVGCGTGAFARRLAGRGIAVDAIDADQRMIDIAAEERISGVRIVRVARLGRGAGMSAPVARPASTLADIRADADRLLPGPTVRKQLFWRYLLVFHQS